MRRSLRALTEKEEPSVFHGEEDTEEQTKLENKSATLMRSHRIIRAEVP